MDGTEPVVHMFWSGGWDSTFRILQLVLLRKRTVQPHYLIDHERQSTLLELKAMANIRRALADVDAEAPSRIRPLKITAVSDVLADPDITEHYRSIRKRGILGTQYEWMARYAEQEQIPRVEVCDYQSSRMAAFVGGKVVPCETIEGVPSWRVADEHLVGDMQLFKRFSLPSFGMVKRDTLPLVEEYGFRQLLGLTWYCHRPIKGKPCGMCNPCSYVIGNRMYDRIPWSARLRRHRKRASRSARDTWRNLADRMSRPVHALAGWRRPASSASAHTDVDDGHRNESRA